MQGDLGEFSAMEWLASKGALVWIPLGHSPDIDLMAEVDGRALRVQVKTSTVKNETPKGHKRWLVAIATSGGNRSWSGRAKKFDPAKVDYLFALVGDGRRWMIPVGSIEAQGYIALGGPKYSEFEVERGQPIQHLVYAEDLHSSRIAGPARGSAGVGEPGRSVKSVATPEWVRIPPPPLSPGSVADAGLETDAPIRFQRTRISPKHQITIPSVPFRKAGLQVGDRLHARADAPGRVILDRIG
jgi:hypothetical protein